MEYLQFQCDDGGRQDAGYRGSTGDCVTRSIAIVTGLPYQEVYDALNLSTEKERPRKGRKRGHARTGLKRRTYERFLFSLGWQWRPTMGIGTGCQVHMLADELPQGSIITALSRHLCAVVDGVVHDTHDPSRGGTRCVYGYYYKPGVLENHD